MYQGCYKFINLIILLGFFIEDFENICVDYFFFFVGYFIKKVKSFDSCIIVDS